MTIVLLVACSYNPTLSDHLDGLTAAGIQVVEVPSEPLFPDVDTSRCFDVTDGTDTARTCFVIAGSEDRRTELFSADRPDARWSMWGDSGLEFCTPFGALCDRIIGIADAVEAERQERLRPGCAR